MWSFFLIFFFNVLHHSALAIWTSIITGKYISVDFTPMLGFAPALPLKKIKAKSAGFACKQMRSSCSLTFDQRFCFAECFLLLKAFPKQQTPNKGSE